MNFNDSYEEMSPSEQHGVQLRQITDVLEGATNVLETDAAFMVIIAEDLLASIALARQGSQRS